MDIVNIDIAEHSYGSQIGKHDWPVHSANKCEGQCCTFHNPSNHKMKNWPMNLRLDNHALVERMCEHRVGHPDPDSVAFFESVGITHMGIHGCDRCCCA